VVETPHRFRSKRQFWSYAGLGLVTRTSAEYRFVGPQRVRSGRPALVRGLNQNHNHLLKEIFKGAAAAASFHRGPLREFYEQRLAAGIKPELARLTLARKLAALTLHLWKKGERYQPEQLNRQAA
jgi:transposase